MFKNIKRNKLDYILTDMLPVEVSELFTLRYFYEYLDESKELVKIGELLNQNKQKNIKVFDSGWNSIPLEFFIYKRDKNMRKMSIPNPLGDILVYQFVSLYEKEILHTLNKNSLFSLRYHRNNNNLYYKNSSKVIINYFSKTYCQIKKRIIEQTGNYYSIEKYKSINDFTNSKKWFSLCSKYKKHLKMDYKDCFRSIYSHVFNWFKYPTIIDSKNSMDNASFYTTLDNVVQRINGSATNGLIVGPEFSRMIAELFLQNIDIKVFDELVKLCFEYNKDYFIGRYVDDIFVFANTEEVLETIRKIYAKVSSDFMISLNESKIQKKDLPFCNSPWFSVTYELSRELSELFYKDDESSEYYYKEKAYINPNVKQKLNYIICQNDLNNQDTIVAYILSTLINKIKPQKKKHIFKEDISKSKILNLLDFAFYTYSFSPSFSNTQKIISIIVYVSDDLNDNMKMKNILNLMFRDYENILKSNVYDIVNLITLMSDYNVELKESQERYIEEEIFKTQDPILIANWLLYSTYSKIYFDHVKRRTMTLVENKIEFLKNKQENFFMYKECWYVFIFKNCPFLNKMLHSDMKNMICSNIVQNPANATQYAKNEILSFLLGSNKGFFCWEYIGKNISRQITFRTHQKTIFRRNAEKYKLFDYASF